MVFVPGCNCPATSVLVISLPIANCSKGDRNTVDFHFSTPHRANPQMRSRRLISQDEFASECCVEGGKRTRVRIGHRRKDDPLCPAIAGQKIDGRIIPGDPCKDRRRDTCKCSYPNRSVPRLENKHREITFSIILALCSCAQIGRNNRICEQMSRNSGACGTFDRTFFIAYVSDETV